MFFLREKSDNVASGSTFSRDLYIRQKRLQRERQILAEKIYRRQPSMRTGFSIRDCRVAFGSSQ